MESSQGFTLTHMAYWGRQTIKFGSILLVVFIVGRTFLTAAIQYWVATHPPAPPPPAADFGPLPPLRFPTKAATERPKSYQLETANGQLPTFGDRTQVFVMPNSSPSLLADQRAKEVAANYGFVFEPSKLSDRTYRWTKSTPLQATFEMDVQNFTFSLKTNYLSKPELISDKNLPFDQEDATQIVKSMISVGQEIPEDLATASGEITFLKAASNELLPAVSFSDADYIQVDIQRTPIDGHKPFYTPEGKKGIVQGIIVGGLSGRDQVVEMEYLYHPIDYTLQSEYPLRSVQSAWQVLQAGEGYIAKKGQFDTAVIRDVYLGYYDDSEEQEYAQPIYVFEGDGEFLGFVPAVDPRLIQQAAPAAKK